MKKVLRAVGITLLCLLLTAVFYVAVVMGQPQPVEDTPDSGQLVRQALPAPLEAPIPIADDEALQALQGVFPAPVMYMGSTNLRFVQGECADLPYEDGVTRVVTLTYQTADFDLLTVTSIYPAQALALLEKDGFVFTGATADRMAQLPCVAMQDGAVRRLHAQSDEALYVFTAPIVSDAALDQWTNGLQLFRPAENESSIIP